MCHTQSEARAALDQALLETISKSDTLIAALEAQSSLDDLYAGDVKLIRTALAEWAEIGVTRLNPRFYLVTLTALQDLASAFQLLEQAALANKPEKFQDHFAIAADIFLKLHAEIDHRLQNGIRSSAFAQLRTSLSDFITIAERSKELSDRIAEHEKGASLAMARIRKNDIDFTVGAYADKFKTEGEKVETAADNWLVAAIVLLVVSAMISLAAWSLPGGLSVEAVAARLVVAAAGLSAAHWCARNYRAMRHIASVYNQKAMALSTFNIFRDSAESGQVKDLILQYAAHSVFSPAVSGFLGGDENIPSTPTLDLVRSMAANRPSA